MNMYKNILIPTDGSELSVRTIKAGVKLAKATGARVTGLFVAPTPTPLVYKGIIPVGYMSPEEHAETISRAAASHLGVIEKAAKVAGVTCQCTTITGDFPAESILQAAAKYKCDLIFMASHGRKGMSALILGSETQKVLAHSTVPVLVHR
jgi:nucleotide-binding universal stress UspA family protein